MIFRRPKVYYSPFVFRLLSSNGPKSPVQSLVASRHKFSSGTLFVAFPCSVARCSLSRWWLLLLLLPLEGCCYFCCLCSLAVAKTLGNLVIPIRVTKWKCELHLAAGGLIACSLRNDASGLESLAGCLANRPTASSPTASNGICCWNLRVGFGRRNFGVLQVAQVVALAEQTNERVSVCDCDYCHKHKKLSLPQVAVCFWWPGKDKTPTSNTKSVTSSKGSRKKSSQLASVNATRLLVSKVAAMVVV